MFIFLRLHVEKRLVAGTCQFCKGWLQVFVVWQLILAPSFAEGLHMAKGIGLFSLKAGFPLLWGFRFLFLLVLFVLFVDFEAVSIQHILQYTRDLSFSFFSIKLEWIFLPTHNKREASHTQVF